MPVLLANALITSGRATFNAGTGVTTAPAANNLSAIRAHIEPMKATAFAVLPEAALTSDYVATVESGTDIKTGDTLTAITLPDGATPWPGDGPTTGNVVWQVVYHKELAGMLLPQRLLYLKRVRGGGPA